MLVSLYAIVDPFKSEYSFFEDTDKPNTDNAQKKHQIEAPHGLLFCRLASNNKYCCYYTHQCDYRTYTTKTIM
jgi:hypothetical protein